MMHLFVVRGGGGHQGLVLRVPTTILEEVPKMFAALVTNKVVCDA